MALRKSIARNSTTGISSGLIQTIEFEEDFIDAIEGVSISKDMPSEIRKFIRNHNVFRVGSSL